MLQVCKGARSLVLYSAQSHVAAWVTFARGATCLVLEGEGFAEKFASPPFDFPTSTCRLRGSNQVSVTRLRSKQNKGTGGEMHQLQRSVSAPESVSPRWPGFHPPPIPLHIQRIPLKAFAQIQLHREGELRRLARPEIQLPI